MGIPVATAWLQSAMSTWWWTLPADQFRVTLTMIALAKEVGGQVVITGTIGELAGQCQVSRGAMRRTLDALTARGFCRVESARGHGGSTAITLLNGRDTSFGHLQVNSATQESGENQRSAAIPPTIGQEPGRPFETPRVDHLEVGEMMRKGQENPGARDHLKAPDPDLCSAITTSSSSDLRSDLQPLSQEDLLVPKSAGPADTTEATEKRGRIDVRKIPARAWAAADYLRERVLGEDATAVVGRRPWGAEVRTGLRLSWAHGFKLINERDGREWDDIAKTVHWLFYSQPPGAKFIVQSPDALRQKWDRIQAVRRNQRAAATVPKPGSDSRPTQQFKKWGDQ